MTTVTQDVKQLKLPVPNVERNGLEETLPAGHVGDFKQNSVAPGIKYWAEDSFPFDLLPAIKELNLIGVGLPGYGCRGGSALLFGVIASKRVRFDESNATFMDVHSGLAVGSIDFEGSEEQKKRWLPPIDLELDFKNRVLYWTDHGDPARSNSVKWRSITRL